MTSDKNAKQQRPKSRLRDEREEIEYIISHYAREGFAARAVLRTSELTQRLRRTVPYLSRKTPEILGKSLVSALREIKLAEAVRLLRMRGGLPVEDIWRCCGFGTRQTFFRVFKKAFGMTPARFRRQELKG